MMGRKFRCKMRSVWLGWLWQSFRVAIWLRNGFNRL